VNDTMRTTRSACEGTHSLELCYVQSIKIESGPTDILERTHLLCVYTPQGAEHCTFLSHTLLTR
jgi:hypothetical protein